MIQGLDPDVAVIPNFGSPICFFPDFSTMELSRFLIVSFLLICF